MRFASPRSLSKLVGVVLVGLLVGGTPRESAADGFGRGHGWLGVAMAKTTDAGGVRVEHVVKGSPADRAGVLPEDRITEIDRSAVVTSRDVVGVIAAHAVGETVVLTVLRGGKPQRLTVVLADFPSSDVLLRMDRVGSPAPVWDSLEPSSGFPTNLAALRGRVVLVDFWATWCGPCRELAPVLSGWQSRYGAQGLSVVGITTDAPEAAARFRESLGLGYPMASDPKAATTMAYGVSALPTLFIVDKRGVVRDVAVGSGGGEEARVEALVAKLLAEPAP